MTVDQWAWFSASPRWRGSGGKMICEQSSSKGLILFGLGGTVCGGRVVNRSSVGRHSARFEFSGAYRGSDLPVRRCRGDAESLMSLTTVDIHKNRS